MFPTSRTAAIADIEEDHRFNTGSPGQYVYRVDSATIKNITTNGSGCDELPSKCTMYTYTSSYSSTIQWAIKVCTFPQLILTRNHLLTYLLCTTGLFYKHSFTYLLT